LTPSLPARPDLLALPSFPTRRSSDLPASARGSVGYALAETRFAQANHHRANGALGSAGAEGAAGAVGTCGAGGPGAKGMAGPGPGRKSTRLKASHQIISDGVLCL